MKQTVVPSDLSHAARPAGRQAFPAGRLVGNDHGSSEQILDTHELQIAAIAKRERAAAEDDCA
jgi:hypothetical protein